MATDYMGFEGKIFYGVAGSTASTEIANTRDITIGTDRETAETTVRPTGASPAPPVKTERVTAITVSIEFQMVNQASDSTLASIRTAAAAGTPIAIRGKDHNTGKGPDCDVTVTERHGKPFKGEQTFDFTCTPTRESGREPSNYV